MPDESVPPGATTDASVVSLESPDPPIPAGTMVGDYRIEDKIGEGGMASVYAAVHPLIGKRAAVKVLNAKLCSDPQTVERFQSEARAANQIGHPNIVDVFAFGTLADKRSYLVMEWLQGETLQARLERGPMAPADGVDILIQIADALEAAHDKGIVHRDLKPDNIYLVPVHGGRRTLVKLLDFGIAKLAGTGEFSQTKTKTGLFVGTPTHVSPEQARGKQVDSRTDLYAMGVTAFQMFLGQLPFDADNAVDIITMHLTKAPPSPRDLWPSIPEPLEQLILGLLAKKAEERPLLAQVSHELHELREQLRGRPATGSFRMIDPLMGTVTPSGGQAAPGTPPPMAVRGDPSGRHGVPRAGVIGPATTAATEPGAEAARQPHVPGHVVEFVPQQLPPRRRWPLVAAALVGVGMLGGAGWLLTHRKPVETPPVEAPKVVAPPVGAPKVVEAPRKAEPESAQLRLEINVPARVLVDGIEVASDASGATATLVPGTDHLIQVTANNYKPFERHMRAEAGEHLALGVTLERKPSLARPSKEKPPNASSGTAPAGPKSKEYMLDPFATPPPKGK